MCVALISYYRMGPLGQKDMNEGAVLYWDLSQWETLILWPAKVVIAMFPETKISWGYNLHHLRYIVAILGI